MNPNDLKAIANEIDQARNNLIERLDTLFGSGAKDTDGAILLLNDAHQKLMDLVSPPAPEKASEPDSTVA